MSILKHLRHSLNHRGIRNSIIDHAIVFNERHTTKTATSIQKNKCYVTPPCYGEISGEKKRFFLYYDISMQFTPVDTSKKSVLHPKDK